jgi:acetyl esterase/lipase
MWRSRDYTVTSMPLRGPRLQSNLGYPDPSKVPKVELMDSRFVLRTSCFCLLSLSLAGVAVAQPEPAADRQAPAAEANAPPVPDSVRAELDIPYAGTDHVRQKLDLYLPKQPANGKLPLVVFIHGGGWQNGQKGVGRKWTFPYVESGDFATASIGYRLSSDAIWPAQIHDCKAAIRWLRANAGKYGIDPDRIAVLGPSAGGHLVAMLGTSGGVAALEGDLGDFDDTSSRVQCVVDFYGPANMLTRDPTDTAPQSRLAALLGGPVQELKERAKEASPQTHVTADDPPFLIVHGTEDPLVEYDQSVQFDAALRAAGVSSVLIRVDGGKHGNFGNPEVDQRVRAFLGKQLLGEKMEISTAPIAARAVSRRGR